MIAMVRRGRLFWVLGGLLLVASFAGTRWILHASGPNDVPEPKGQTLTGDFVSNIGFVDALTSVRKLTTGVGGRIVATYFEELDEVPEGQLLLSVDNTIAKANVKAARADLEAAQAKLKQAQQLPKQHESKVIQQQKAIEAQKAKLEGLRNEQALKERLSKTKPPLINQEELNVSIESVKAQEAFVAAEEAKLTELQLFDPNQELTRAKADVDAKQAQVDKARQALFECDLYAPTAGFVLRQIAHEGELIGPDAKIPALEFCPSGPPIIRAEVMQEWANRVQVGQKVIIEDDTRGGVQWQGTIIRVSDWFSHRRNILLEPGQPVDVRTLECIVAVEPGGPKLRIGQRMRVIIK